MVTKTKQIMLLRHAKAEMNSASGDDGRALTTSGRQRARELGQMLLEQKLIPQAIYSSTANRALETAELICEQLAIDSHDVVKRDELYQADAETILSLLRGIDERIRRVMIVGHNPALEQLIQTLLSPETLRGTLHLSPADMAMLAFEDNWATLREHICMLEYTTHNPHGQIYER
jgi:phosphohistidine phosphatase